MTDLRETHSRVITVLIVTALIVWVAVGAVWGR